MKVSAYFDIREFVPKIIWSTFGENSIWYIRPEIIQLADFYREWFEASVTINDWHIGGQFQNRGYRTPNSKVGSTYSQHKMGCAFDCTVKGLTANKVREEILDHQEEFIKAGLTALEDGFFAPTWIHSDIRPTNLRKIMMVSPSI